MDQCNLLESLGQASESFAESIGCLYAWLG